MAAFTGNVASGKPNALALATLDVRGCDQLVIRASSIHSHVLVHHQSFHVMLEEGFFVEEPFYNSSLLDVRSPFLTPIDSYVK
ncbi:hypothetical protein AVEN_94190-1 [Araneus ventricosus]|uniref:Uncharacterized protein n=1 Tax=Araneus ventricosus TaxID=182803 RepID=A0A4Y2R863_ARAVE|nr:hypothetical protein AVEN_191892-1 [Araneus ventricosus]GBN71928.1 hypothetical protein AVEN_83453-1 [Araneus ventricosus]GBN72351.1 hypothetical protein AVEN_195203-1 [Araneus ventricosus]GBN72385.1 hypothetical protein AVEN_94190-1 [Araneus ventricosus]